LPVAKAVAWLILVWDVDSRVLCKSINFILVSTFVDYLCVSFINQIKTVKLNLNRVDCQYNLKRRIGSKKGDQANEWAFVITVLDTVMKRTHLKDCYCIKIRFYSPPIELNLYMHNPCCFGIQSRNLAVLKVILIKPWVNTILLW